MFYGLNAKKIIALYLILKIWSKKSGVSDFHFCSVYVFCLSKKSTKKNTFCEKEKMPLISISYPKCFEGPSLKGLQGCGKRDFSHLSMDNLGLIFCLSKAKVYLSKTQGVNQLDSGLLHNLFTFC